MDARALVDESGMHHLTYRSIYTQLLSLAAISVLLHELMIWLNMQPPAQTLNPKP